MTQQPRRVVVTGVGLVSPLGIGTEETWQGLLAGRSGAGPITHFDASHHSTHFACEVKGFDPLAWMDKKDVKKVDRFIQFAIAAADLAVKDAGYTVEPGRGGPRRRLHRQRDRRLRDDRARARGADEGRASADQPVLHPRRDREPGLGLGLDPHRGEGAELRHVHGVHAAAPTRWGTRSA